MMALFIAITAVAVERFINRKRLRLHEVLADVGWLTLLFATIEFAYLMFVEAATLNFKSAVWPLWYTVWPVFKSLILEAAIAVLLILTSVWLESADINIELRRPRRFTAVARGAVMRPSPPPAAAAPGTRKCDIEWREAT